MILFQHTLLRPRRLGLPALAVLLAGCQMGGSQAALESELRQRAEENTQLQLIIHDLEVERRATVCQQDAAIDVSSLRIERCDDRVPVR